MIRLRALLLALTMSLAGRSGSVENGSAEENPADSGVTSVKANTVRVREFVLQVLKGTGFGAKRLDRIRQSGAKKFQLQGHGRPDVSRYNRLVQSFARPSKWPGSTSATYFRGITPLLLLPKRKTGRRAASLPRFFVARNLYLNPVTRKGLPPEKRYDTIPEKSLTT